MASPDIDTPMPHPFGFTPESMLPSEPLPLKGVRTFMIYEDLSRGSDPGEDGPSTLTPEEAAMAEIRTALDALRPEELHNP